MKSVPMKDFLLSVVIPSYNEMANLQKGTLDKVQHFLEKKKYKHEVIVVDDGSDDGSCQFVRKFVKENKGFRLIENNHLGKAGAVTTGVLTAKGDYILFTDMDQATPIEELDKLLPYFGKASRADLGLLVPMTRQSEKPRSEGRQRYDIVIGSRNNKRRGAPFSRLVMAKGMIVLRSVFIGLSGIHDTQCGFKMFTKRAAYDIFSKIKEVHHGFGQIEGSSVTAGFDVEVLYIGNRDGYRIKEVAVDWLYVETRRVSPIRDSIEGLIDLVRIKYNIMKGIYK